MKKLTQETTAVSWTWTLHYRVQVIILLFDLYLWRARQHICANHHFPSTHGYLSLSKSQSLYHLASRSPLATSYYCYAGARPRSPRSPRSRPNKTNCHGKGKTEPRQRHRRPDIQSEKEDHRESRRLERLAEETGYSLTITTLLFSTHSLPILSLFNFP